MGLSDIAKAPVSHGVEPHDLETGLSLRFRLQPSEPPAGPRRGYRASGFVLGRIPALQKAAREGPEIRPERSYAKRSISASASVISGISDVGAKPSSAGTSTAWASAMRPVNW